MKRLILLAVCATFIIFGSSYIQAQQWAPEGPPPMAGPPMAPVGPPPGPACGPQPLPGCPPPDQGGVPCGPPVDFAGPCAPPSCGTSSNFFDSVSAGGLVAWQVNEELGKFIITSHGEDLFNKTSTTVDLQANGIWVGAASRISWSDLFGIRVEGRYLIPTEDGKKIDTFTQLAVGNSIGRSFNSKLNWALLDGLVTLNPVKGFSVLTGVRWDNFYLKLNSPPNIAGFSTSADESDLLAANIQVYGGFEWTWAGCDSGILVRVIASPWTFSHVEYGMTYGDPGGLPSIRDDLNCDSKQAASLELYLSYGMRLSKNMSVAGFGSVSTLNILCDTSLKASEVGVGSVSQPWEVGFHRQNYMLGGNVAVAFGSIL